MRPVVAIIVQWAYEDTVLAVRHLIRSTLAGSAFMPRIGRFCLYRLAGVSTRTANILPGVTILGPGRHLQIGDRTYVSGGCLFDCEGPITIGADCLIGNRVTILTSDHPREGSAFAIDPVQRGVQIGDRVWLGAQALIVPGVTVHSDVVVAAGAVVTQDCLPLGVYAGVPARRIKELEPSS